MIIESAPGWAEVKERRPLAGRVGKSFEDELFVWDRTQFYITNAVKCHTEEPTPEQTEKCEPFLRMEIAIFKPKLVVTLGHVAFNMLCGEKFSECIGKITRSEKFGIKVFAIHRPTVENMPLFARDMKTLNRIMTYYLTPF
jgi:DNA polymerase